MNQNTQDSGVSWIGHIPEGWAVEPFRRLFRESREVNGQAPVGPMLSISGYRGVEEKVYESESLIRDDNQLENYRVVRPGQLAVNTMWLNYAGLGVSSILGHVSPAYRAYWISDRLDGRYAHHLLRSTLYVQGYSALLTGIRPNSLQMSRPDLMAFPVLVPPLEEQRAIAEYLNRETAQIDAFVAKNEELIALLTERRAAAIGRAVTRGLDEKADRSAEGPDWIGPVPAHWTIQPIKRGYSVVLGKMLNESMSVGELVPYVRAANIQPGGIDLSDVKEMRATVVERKALALRAGDVVFVEGGGGYGRSDFLADELPGWVFQNHVIRLRPRPGHDGRFLNYWLQHVRRLGHYEALSAFATIPNVSGDKLGRIEMPVPSLSEQREIVAHIEAVTRRIDDAIAVADQSIELARERRAALISAAVTGKIDMGVAA